MAKSRPVHERVHDHVRAAELTHAELAKRTGWSEQRVYRVLNGKTDLSAEDMEVLAVILEKPVAALFRDPEAKRAS
jgi:transcriptional regulator with XRE-family HTH domain